MKEEYPTIKNNINLPSFNAHYLQTGEDMDVMYYYMHWDCIKKERLSALMFEYNSEVLKEIRLDDLTLIIYYNKEHYNKKDTLEYLLKYYIELGIENIIITTKNNNFDSEKIQKYVDELKNFNIISNENNQLNNRSKAINKALKKVNTSHVIITNNDSFINKKIFLKSLDCLSFYDFVFPSNRSVSYIDSLDVLKEVLSDNPNIDVKKHYLNFDNGLFFCKKESLFNIGAFNPMIKGEKFDNIDLNMRINLSNFTVKRLNTSIYHWNNIKIKNYDEQRIINHFNLLKFNDINLLIYPYEEMYYFSQKYHTESFNYENNKYKISVIIPIYNCEKFYLDRCISSLKNQTLGFENIEIILIDDASKIKKSKDLIKAYSDKYENVKAVFLNQNGGAGIARNIGIENASSEFITFLDYDDFYVNNICETALYYIHKNDSDIFIANYINIAIKRPYLVDWDFLGLEHDEKYIKDYKDDNNVLFINPSIWTKTYRKEFLLNKNLKFANYKVAQDTLFNILTLFNAEGICIKNIPAVAYGIRTSENPELCSRTSIINKNSLITRLKVYKDIIKLYGIYSPELIPKILNNQLNYWLNTHLFKSDLNYDEFVEVCDEAEYLFELRLKNQTIKLEEKKSNFFQNIVNVHYKKAYGLYKEYKT